MRNRTLCNLTALLSVMALSLTHIKGNEVNLGDPLTNTPGLSGSLDFANFDDVKDALVKDLVMLVNSISFPDINFDNGHLNNNDLKISAQGKSLNF